MKQNNSTIILASASPRRAEIFDQMLIKDYLVIPAEIDETPKKAEIPRLYSVRMAQHKGQKVFELIKKNKSQYQNISDKFTIIACDTVCAVGRRILPKAENDQEVEKCLRLISGRRHRIYSTVFGINQEGKEKFKIAQSIVKFKRFTEQEISLYIQTKEGIGKAGGYAIQGSASCFVSFISGSYSNIVGLPIYETKNILEYFQCRT
ncbi:Maf family protein [Flavobacteriaceae bacterium]|nr:Maf family protein [Flavobacteriaceae bacterium]